METRPPRYYFYSLISTHYKKGSYVPAPVYILSFKCKFFHRPLGISILLIKIDKELVSTLIKPIT